MQGIIPMQKSGGHTRVPHLPIQNVEGPVPAPGMTAEPFSVRVVAPAPPSSALPESPALVAVLKQNGMHGTSNNGVIRAARLLLLVAAGGPPVSMKRIGSVCRLSTSGAARLLASMLRRQWILRTGTYGLVLTTEAKRLLSLVAAPGST